MRSSRRTFLKGAGIAAGLLASETSRGRKAWGAGKDRPNILLMMADDMGFSDLGCYGGEIETPNLDRLAREGLRFTQFYNNAKCVPTRASLLTGLYSQRVKLPAHPDDGNVNCVTIAEALRSAGYRTIMAGKWHRPGMPVHWGFDRHFGLLDGACNFWNPGHARGGEAEPARKFDYQEHRWAVEDKEYKPYTPAEKDFYTTDAFSDYAIRCLGEYEGEEKPFFLYVAYNAPHYPMHAWPEDISTYRGKYLGGWEKLRASRFARQRKLGLFGDEATLSPADPALPGWDEIADQDDWDLKMSVYAAMVDRMDQNIGRILGKIEGMGELDHTLVLFLADNGGSSEHFNSKPDFPPGPLEGFHTVDAPWANASNTPFRRYKSWNHEGGICTPLIARWPGVIEPGTFTDQMGHVIDIMPTCLEVAGAAYPGEYEQRGALPLDGKSLAPILRGHTRDGHDAFCWQHQRSRAVRQGPWKLVTRGDAPWELYDLGRDRTETNNLAGRHPERVKEMSAVWAAWANRVGAPLPRGAK